MLCERGNKSWGMLAIGLVAGLTLGGAMAVGMVLGQRGPALSRLPSLADIELKAAASHGADTFAIATGYVDEDVEGLYTLDFLTGDLQCFVVNPRTGATGGWFKANVANVLSVERGKKPNSGPPRASAMSSMPTRARSRPSLSRGRRPLPAPVPRKRARCGWSASGRPAM
jgi:hypothetical protein